MNPLNDITAVYMQEVFKPQLGKGAGSSEPAGGKTVEKGKDDAESSAKRIRQAVYDIRYRARREDVKLDQAFSQYMGHTTMNAQEKAAVKEKLGLTAGSGASPVKEEMETKKYKVRVKDKESGKSYVRYATREKINQLRSNPNISSVEMTGYGDPYEGERKKGKATAKVTSGKGLDPVGREDKDIDNDGDHDKTDKYLLNRRKVRGAAIEKKNVKEGFSNWREDLYEVIDDSSDEKQIKEKKVKNVIKINPELKESIESLGGLLVDVEELNCVLEKISDEELYFLSDDLIEEIVEDVFYDFLEEGYDVEFIENILCESLDTSFELINEKVDMAARAAERKSFAASSEKSAKEARKRGADVVRKEKRAERIQKVKDTVKKVGSSIKSGLKKAAKSAIGGASYAAGKAVGTAKKAGAAAKSAGEKASETAKKVGATAKAGYEAGKKSTESGESGSTATATKTRAPKTYRYVRPETKKKSGLASKVGSLLKKGLKKAVGKTARVVSKGADKVASKLGEEIVNEKITAKTDMGAAIKDFYGSKSPQLAGRTKEERRKSAIAAVLTARRGGKKLGEAVTQMPGRETTPPSGTTAKQDDIQKKQMLANKQKMMQKQMMLQRQELQLQKQGKLPMGHAVEEFEIEEGMTMKDFKKKRSALKQKEKRAADKLGRSRRAGIHDDKASPERAARHRANVDPDYDHDDEEDMYPGGKLKNPKKIRKAKAVGEITKEEFVNEDEYRRMLAKERQAERESENEFRKKGGIGAMKKGPKLSSTKRSAAAGKDYADSQMGSIRLHDKATKKNKNIIGLVTQEELVTELNRAEKETGIDTKTGKPTQKGGAKDDTAFTMVKKMMRSQTGKPAGQRKKEPGKKPPTAGSYGAPQSPAQKIALRRAAAKRSQDNMSSRFD